ncbi:hypothetical protein [Mesorhizobium zhangyense]|nr:hypothetical protein [Mesorhizobium zhangyense]
MGKVNIGLKQAQRLVQLSPKARFAFLAELKDRQESMLWAEAGYE